MNVLVAQVEDTFAVQELLSNDSEAVNVALLSPVECVGAWVIDLEFWRFPELFFSSNPMIIKDFF